MNTLRFKALETVQNREPFASQTQGIKYPEIFGKYVFDRESMRSYLDKDAYKSVIKAIEEGSRISKDTANRVANGMKNWATDHNTTHYTHWFQPLNGLTAEKHDSFFDLDGGNVIERFTGSALIQQEPDASSLPSGGLRNTFEARGYTAWDPSSPAFLMKTRSGMTLCIPTIYVAYTGEALDFKAPLLKALYKLKKEMVPVCNYFDESVKKVDATLGWEQEYFLVDAALYDARPDLVLTNRTLFGLNSARDQQLEDHYFGSIPERILAFMVNLEEEAMKLGIPLKTRHNEVAPSQYEFAPLFEDANLAVDHNQLLMDLIQKIARRHQLRAILHEKPFKNINGSGKHCNWSFMTDTGVNLLQPGKTAQSKLQFLTFLVNIIKGVHDHADLLRASIASAGNDHRLGANEAPPAIISIFLGKDLTQIINDLEGNGKAGDSKSMADLEKQLEINIPQIPELLRDNTDRNRTSPFAFTGNKFEFRAVGSSANTSAPMIILNTIMADQLKIFKKEVDTRIKKGDQTDVAILKVLQQYIKASKNILFEGNNYSDDWVKEAKKRGLSNIKSTPEALDSYLSKKSKKLFKDTGVLEERELDARYEIMQDMYSKKLQIESRLFGDMAMNHIIPAAIEYQNKLLENARGLNEIGIKEGLEERNNNIREISEHINAIRKLVREMVEERRKANTIENCREKSIAYCNNVSSYFDQIRYHIDRLELNIDDKLWPMPKYRELLFLR